MIFNKNILWENRYLVNHKNSNPLNYHRIFIKHWSLYMVLYRKFHFWNSWKTCIDLKELFYDLWFMIYDLTLCLCDMARNGKLCSYVTTCFYGFVTFILMISQKNFRTIYHLKLCTKPMKETQWLLLCLTNVNILQVVTKMEISETFLLHKIPVPPVTQFK